jgi:hypothetical protein
MSGSGPSLIGVVATGAGVHTDVLATLARLAGRPPLLVRPWDDDAERDA